MEATICNATNSRLHACSFLTAVPMPNTRMYELARETHPEQLAKIDYRGYEGYNAQLNFSDIPDELFFRMREQANRRFYLRPSRICRILRDHPSRASLPKYGFFFFKRAIRFTPNILYKKR